MQQGSHEVFPLDKKGHQEPTITYLIGKRDGEIQHLAAQLPFGLVLHVGNLHFNCHRTLRRNKRRL